MSDEQQTTPAPTEPPQPNTSEAREPDGTLKDQSLSSAPPPTKDTDSQTQSTETKPDGEAKPGDEKKPDEAPKVPEKYEFKAPEGLELDPKALEAVTPIFKELGLTQDQAQKLVDWQAARDKEAMAAGTKAFDDLNAKWQKDVIADKELGNGKDGLAPAVAKAVSNAINAMPNADAFRHILDVTGIGNNPDFIRGMYAVAQKLGEGSHVAGSGPAKTGQAKPNGAVTAAQSIYPNLPSAN